MLDWNNYRSELMQRLGELGKLTRDHERRGCHGNAGNKTDLLGAKCVNSLPRRAQSQLAATAALLFTPTPL